MQFISVKPRYGTYRLKSRLLWWPVTIYIYHESGETEKSTRWGEFATWEEKWVRGRVGDFWKKIRWIDKGE